MACEHPILSATEAIRVFGRVEMSVFHPISMVIVRKIPNSCQRLQLGAQY